MLKLKLLFTLIGALVGAWFVIVGLQNLLGAFIPMNGWIYTIVGGILLAVCGGIFVRCRG